MAQLHIYQHQEISALYQRREFETKIGDTIQLIQNSDNWEEEIANSNANFVLIGVCEDIGIRANLGRPGAANSFQHMLPSLLNMQSNRFTSGSEILLLGYLDFTQELEMSNKMSVTELRNLCLLIDSEVSKLVETIVKSNKIPIVIGGGHNNSFPIIQGTSNALQKQISVINIDAHSDYRTKEGRHSGNGFRYAMDEGCLKQYQILGLHESYNSENVLVELDANPNIQYYLFEDIKIRKRLDATSALNNLINKVVSDHVGLEIDIDSVSMQGSSAMTNTGWETNELRSFLHQVASLCDLKYLHIAEAIIEGQTNWQDRMTAKFIAHLITDVVKVA